MVAQPLKVTNADAQGVYRFKTALFKIFAAFALNSSVLQPYQYAMHNA